MKKPDILLKIVIALSIIIFIATFVDYLALHDIGKDYVSKSALLNLEVETSKELPDWTNTEGEWLVVGISYLIRFFAIIIVLTALYFYRKNFLRNSTK